MAEWADEGPVSEELQLRSWLSLRHMGLSSLAEVEHTNEALVA
jgi:hypothetical protein